MKKDKNKQIQKSGKKQTSIVRSSAAEYLTFVAATGEGGVEAVYADENIWLSQKMMGVLYDVNVRTVNKHLKKIFAVKLASSTKYIKKENIKKSASGWKICYSFGKSSTVKQQN
jgi:hypothetical protein